MHMIPENLNSIFPNLIALQITGTHLRHLSAVDLRPLPNMQALDFSGNEIETIRQSTFDHTPRLRIINLSMNDIRVIEGNPFARLSQLEWLSLAGNICTGRWRTTRREVVQFIPQLLNDCRP